MDTNQRLNAVLDLVHVRTPVNQAIQALRAFPWDSDEELVTLGPEELRAVLDKFIHGDLSPHELEAWANGVEGRDDIEFTPPEIIDLVAEVANPLLFSPLTLETARDLVARTKAL